MSTDCHLQVGVKIVLKNKEGKFLLLRRSLAKYPNVLGRWDIPGGRINPGTPLLENLRREIKEETNLDFVGNPLLLTAQDILREQKHVVRLTYLGSADGEVKLDEEENDQFHWLTWDELIHFDDIGIYFKELLQNKLIQNELIKRSEIPFSRL